MDNDLLKVSEVIGHDGLVEKIHEFEKQLLDGKLVFVDDHGLSLKPNVDNVPSPSGSDNAKSPTSVSTLKHTYDRVWHVDQTDSVPGK